MRNSFLLYGASGYTGSLIAEEACRAGLRPTLAGRSADKLAPLARRLGLEWKAFDLEDETALRREVRAAGLVLHAAGPYSRTGHVMISACIAEAAHYVDICGEIAVLDAASKRDHEARARGVMLLCGAGFDVVPSDCMIAWLKRRLSSADRVRLFIGGAPTLSRGTTRTLAESIALGTMVRRDDKLVELAHPPRGTCDFGSGPKAVIGVSLGDVVTGWWSAGMPNIEVYFESSPALEKMAGTPRLVRHMLSTRVGQWALNIGINRLPPGPSPEQRMSLRTTLIGQAADSIGNSVRSRLVTPESYSLSATTAVEIVRRALAGRTLPGFQTPATVHGADFIASIPGVVLDDLE